MTRTALALLLAAIGSAATAASPAPITPFTAEYVALRNGKELGRTSMDFSRNADDTWTLRTTTRGTSGLAKMAGLDVNEESTLRWRDGVLESLSYDFKQQAALKQRNRHIDFDWKNQLARSEDGDKKHDYTLVPGLIDRQAITLALTADLIRGAQAFQYKVASRDDIDDVRYTRCGEPEIKVPAGAYASVCLERVRDKRASRSWFAESIGWLPVQIEQVEKKGDTITLQLTSLQR